MSARAAVVRLATVLRRANHHHRRPLVRSISTSSRPQPQQQCAIARPSFIHRGDHHHYRLFSTTNTSETKEQKRFDPLQASSTILKQSNDKELTEDELALKTALQEYERDLDDASQLPHRLEDLQHAYTNLGYWYEALRVEQTKCDLYVDGTDDSDDYADSLHAQGKLYLRQEDFSNSKRLYRKSLEYYERTQNHVQRGHVLISLAGWYYFSNHLDEAMRHLQESEPLLDSNPSLLAKSLDNQGLIYRLWGDFDSALDKYQQALQVVVDHETKLALSMHVADMLVALEQIDEALELYRNLLASTTDRGVQGVLWHNLAMIHVDQGDYELALEEFHQALQIKQETGGEHNPEVATTWNSLGALHAGVLDEKVQAIECFKQALLIARINAEDPKTDPDVLNAMQNISLIEKQMNNEQK
jgi:tetratricopeptide (TPR) repeat protein